ncbi:hypothetical protein ABW19_dt0205775 [Dactylella cylindrospora]|nr:hypothetical protein ABW19_dt0205775 [Dactylella cylindrospora]
MNIPGPLTYPPTPEEPTEKELEETNRILGKETYAYIDKSPGSCHRERMRNFPPDKLTAFIKGSITCAQLYWRNNHNLGGYGQLTPKYFLEIWKKENHPLWCSHKRVWEIIFPEKERCAKCKNIFHKFIFECPDCTTRCCAKCVRSENARPGHGSRERESGGWS